MTKVEEFREDLVRSVTVLSINMGSATTQERLVSTVTGVIDALIAAVRSEEREAIEAEGFLFRDCNSVLEISNCSAIPTEELKSISSAVFDNGGKDENH